MNGACLFNPDFAIETLITISPAKSGFKAVTVKFYGSGFKLINSVLLNMRKQLLLLLTITAGLITENKSK